MVDGGRMRRKINVTPCKCMWKINLSYDSVNFHYHYHYEVSKQ